MTTSNCNAEFEFVPIFLCVFFFVLFFGHRPHVRLRLRLRLRDREVRCGVAFWNKSLQRKDRLVVWCWHKRTWRLLRVLQCLLQDVGDSLNHHSVRSISGSERSPLSWWRLLAPTVSVSAQWSRPSSQVGLRFGASWRCSSGRRKSQCGSREMKQSGVRRRSTFCRTQRCRTCARRSRSRRRVAGETWTLSGAWWSSTRWTTWRYQKFRASGVRQK